ncbi:MAG: hypothetical protein WKF73_10825 [Nocardioidaceae bacterium]
MTAIGAPIPAEQLTIVPANEASWEDLVAQAAHLSHLLERSGRGQGRQRHLGGDLLHGPEVLSGPRHYLSPRPGDDRLRPRSRRPGA